MSAVLDTQAFVTEISGKGAAAQLAAVSKRFAQTRVLHSLTLDITPGSFIAIIGRSGCGKTTLLRLLAGLETADAGRVLVAGDAPKAASDDVRFMFQDARLLPWKNVIDNVSLGLGRDQRGRAMQTLERVGLADRAGDWPAHLSGGQKQRVALARALVHRPRLLLLDEPLGAVDALTRIDMQRLIETLWQEHQFTAVLVTHDVGEAIALADRIVLIEQGDIVLDIDVPLPRPRRRGSVEAAELEARILSCLFRDAT